MDGWTGGLAGDRPRKCKWLDGGMEKWSSGGGGLDRRTDVDGWIGGRPTARMQRVGRGGQSWINDSRGVCGGGGGTRPWKTFGPRGKRPKSVSKSPKPTMQLLAIAEEQTVQGKYFLLYIWSPESLLGNGINGARGKVPPPPPGFSSRGRG